MIEYLLVGEHTEPNVPTEWLDMVNRCVDQMKIQIQKEFNAAIQYLAMAAHFSKDTINRPGFAHMFFDAASEEREHGIKLISYLLMRGSLISNVSSLIDTNVRVSRVSILCMSN